jgi:hypothetical protein
VSVCYGHNPNYGGHERRRKRSKEIFSSSHADNPRGGDAVFHDSRQSTRCAITYGNDEDQGQYLKIYHEMIGWADVFDDISSLRRQLVIFGQKTPSEDIIWTDYVYDRAGFIKL